MLFLSDESKGEKTSLLKPLRRAHDLALNQSVSMDRIGDALDGRDVVWTELLDAFAALDENERRRFSWIAPRESDLKWLRQTIVQEKVDRLVGIGCGSGFLERIVADYAGELVS